MGSSPRPGPTAPEARARQCEAFTTAAEHAGLAARRRGIRWLAHLDADELFLVTPAAFHAHFSGLDAAGVSHCTYANHEGVAEGADVAATIRAAAAAATDAFWLDLR